MSLKNEGSTAVDGTFHEMTKKCWCNPKVLSFKGDKSVSAVLLSYVRVLKEQMKAGKVNTSFLEIEAEKLLRKLASIK